MPPCDAGMYNFLTQLKAAVDGSAGARLHPKSSSLPTTKGELTIEVSDNRTVTILLMGTDGVVRSGTITLA